MSEKGSAHASESFSAPLANHIRMLTGIQINLNEF